MSAIPVLQYILGLGIFGFVWWLTNGIMDDFIAINIHTTGDLWNFLQYLWIGIIIIYLIFGGWWLIRKYDEKAYKGGL